MINTFIEKAIGDDDIIKLVKNNYGNYVVQKALKLATGKYKMMLINAILKNLDKIGEVKLMLKWQNIVEGHVMTYHRTLEHSLNVITDPSTDNSGSYSPNKTDNYNGKMSFPFSGFVNDNELTNSRNKNNSSWFYPKKGRKTFPKN